MAVVNSMTVELTDASCATIQSTLGCAVPQSAVTEVRDAARAGMSVVVNCAVKVSTVDRLLNATARRGRREGVWFQGAKACQRSPLEGTATVSSRHLRLRAEITCTTGG